MKKKKLFFIPLIVIGMMAVFGVYVDRHNAVLSDITLSGAMALAHEEGGDEGAAPCYWAYRPVGIFGGGEYSMACVTPEQTRCQMYYATDFREGGTCKLPE